MRGFFLPCTSLHNFSTQVTNSLHVSFSFLQYHDARAMRVSYLSFESLYLTLRNKPKYTACMPVSPFVRCLCYLTKGEQMKRMFIWTTSTYLFRGDLGEAFYNMRICVHIYVDDATVRTRCPHPPPPSNGSCSTLIKRQGLVQKWVGTNELLSRTD